MINTSHFITTITTLSTFEIPIIKPNDEINNNLFLMISDDQNLTNYYNNGGECEIVNDDFAGPSSRFLLLITTLWSVISLIGILANLVVIIVMISGNKLTSATHYFIINLAASDLVFLLTCPTLALVNLNGLIDYNLLPQFLGKIICKFDYFSSHVSVFITCLTLMSMTFDRYLVIMHPLKALTYRTKTKAILINVTIWLLSILLSIPHGYFRILELNTEENSSYCTNSRVLEETLINIGFVRINLELFNLSYTILISYIIPFISILICYFIMLKELRKEKPMIDDPINRKSNKARSKSRRRVLIMIALVTILFGFTWFPLHSFLFAMKVLKCFPFGNSSLYTFKTLTHTLPYLNSMLNPFFYTIMGNNFRKSIRKKFTKKSNHSDRLKSYYSNTRFNNKNNQKKESIISNNNPTSIIRKSSNNESISSAHEKIVFLNKKRNSNSLIDIDSKYN